MTDPEDQQPAGAREFDIVLFGATGFTGKLTAEYLATQLPAGSRWALAGRDQAKLAAVRADLAGIDQRWRELALLSADVTDLDSMRALAGRARVLISTVGPYLRYGEPLVAACAAAGTDYLDLTGEPEFVDLMYTRYHHQASQTGARLVHCCGFDSIPHDLGVLFTVGQLPPEVAITVDGVVRAGGSLSGGTLHSAVNAFSRLREAAAAAKARRRLEPRPDGRRARATATPPRRVDGLWLLPLPTIDPQVVVRSARALPGYGPDFTYHHYAGVRRLPVAVAGTLALTGVAMLAQLPPTRSLLLSRIKPGDGPSPQRRAKGWFTVRFTGRGGGRTVLTEVSGGDPGYGETAKMLGEAALCLAFDELAPSSGQLTPAVAMGQPLIDRLIAAGIEFRVISSAESS
ncbi:MAG: saccharopine dehydrogenase NADP-binding domain-containing protein [Jatrophihabitantaceae bacterium]